MFDIDPMKFKKKVFTHHEIESHVFDTLAIIFCIKEAVIKILDLPNQWLDIDVKKDTYDRFTCTILNPDIQMNILSMEVSTSHEDDMIVALVILVLLS